MAAGWGTTSIQLHTSSQGTGEVSSTTNSRLKAVKHSMYGDTMSAAGQDYSTKYVFSYPDYPQRPIVLDPDWATLLNPLVSPQNTTVFELIMQQRFLPDPHTIPYEAAITAMITNGLANVGYERTLQGSLKTVTGKDGTEYIDGNYWVSWPNTAAKTASSPSSLSPRLDLMISFTSLRSKFDLILFFNLTKCFCALQGPFSAMLSTLCSLLSNLRYADPAGILSRLFYRLYA